MPQPREKNDAQSFLPVPVLVFAVGAFAFLLYLRSAWFQFVYDDQAQVLDEPLIHSWKLLGSYFTQAVRLTGYYRPLFTTWFRFNDWLFGQHPAGWHITSALLNAAVAVVVFLLARALMESNAVAIVAALLYAAHPTHIESVAWVSGVCDVLMCLFFVAALLAYLRAFSAESKTKWLIASLFLLAAALLSKEPAATFSGIVAVHAFLFTEGSWPRKLQRAVVFAIPYALLTVIYLVIRKYAVTAVVPIRSSVTAKTMVLTAPSLLWFYLKKLAYPTGISLFYNDSYVTSSGGFLLPLLIIVVAIALLLVWAKYSPNDGRLILFSAAWILITLAPCFYIRSFDSNELVHVRYLYLPSVGFCFLIALALCDLLNTRPQSFALWSGLVVLLFSGLTLAQEGYWASDFALYRRAVDIAPHHTTALNNLARVYVDRGQFAIAVPIFREVLATDPNSPAAHYNLGYIYYREGDFPTAEAELRQALAANTGDAFYHLYLGLTLFREGRAAEAEPEIRDAIAISPGRPGYHLALSAVLEARGDLQGALDEARTEAVIEPGNMQVQSRVQALQAQLANGKH
jgi:Flp pilus assembly protein TadD